MAITKKRAHASKLSDLKSQYEATLPSAERLRTCIVEQFSSLIQSTDVTLGVPLESRIKSWASVEEKIERKSAILQNIVELQDLIGVRFIVLFQRDVKSLHEVILQHMIVHSQENTADRLSESQFGYQSQHYVVSLKPERAAIPSYAGLDNIKAELQVRTLAQHIWAAASHKLQYKQEQGVPAPLRRSINRASALLEVVDLEFSRVLVEREVYNSSDAALNASDDDLLNVELVRSFVEETFPDKNRGEIERYDELLANLLFLGVTTAGKLKSILQVGAAFALESDRKRVQSIRAGEEPPDLSDENRINRGVFYTCCGLAREALRKEFGDKRVDSAIMAKRSDPSEADSNDLPP